MTQPAHPDAVPPPWPLRAIETYYNGHHFRSRLEARWAVFMDALNLGYRYEAEGYELDGLHYLPDFYIPAWDAFLEVKPLLPDDGAILKAMRLARASTRRVFMLIGEARPAGYDVWRWGLTLRSGVVWNPGLVWCACAQHGVQLHPWPAFADDEHRIEEAFCQAAEIRFEFRR